MIRLAEPYISDEIKEKILEVIDSKQYVDGRYTREFEERFANYIGVKHAVAVSSGTSALFLILRALGIGRGDKVAVPSFTFIATASQAVELGAEPVFIDVDPETMTLDPYDLEKKMDPTVKAIIPVHLFGHPADLDPVIELAEKYGAYVIEDAAQAHGARYKGKRVGGIGHVGYFSLYPSKNMGVYGEGGVITTDDEELAQRIRSLKNHGIRNGEFVMFGYNMKFNEIGAVVALEQLRLLESWNKKRRENASIYTEAFRDLDIETPIEREWAYHVYNLYTLKTGSRDRIRKVLMERGVATGVYYDRPIHTLEIVRERFGYTRLPITEDLAKKVISLPVHPLLTGDDLETVIKGVREALQTSP